MVVSQRGRLSLRSGRQKIVEKFAVAVKSCAHAGGDSGELAPHCLCPRKMVQGGFDSHDKAFRWAMENGHGPGRQGPGAEVWVEADLVRLNSLEK